jgi:hypothetical protein
LYAACNLLHKYSLGSVTKSAIKDDTVQTIEIPFEGLKKHERNILKQFVHTYMS